MSYVITLPWPPKELSPNARVYFRKKADFTRSYRHRAYEMAQKVCEMQPQGEGEILVTCEFYPPDRRRRDLDGMFSSIKAGLDGIADSLCVNDNRFAFQIHRREPVERGKVVVTVG